MVDNGEAKNKDIGLRVTQSSNSCITLYDVNVNKLNWTPICKNNNSRGMHFTPLLKQKDVKKKHTSCPAVSHKENLISFPSTMMVAS